MTSPRDESLAERPFLLRPRDATVWRDMALVTQANLVALRVQECRRAGVPSDRHPVRTPAPGVVKKLRAHLLDHQTLTTIPAEELPPRCRLTWGQFSGFCWLFNHDDPNQPPDFHTADPAAARCGGALASKLEEVRRTLWRVRFEQQMRFTPEFRLRPDFHDLKRSASEIAVEVYGEPLHTSAAEYVVLYACELAGVFGALRWAMDDRWGWEQAGICDVGME